MTVSGERGEVAELIEAAKEANLQLQGLIVCADFHSNWTDAAKARDRLDKAISAAISFLARGSE